MKLRDYLRDRRTGIIFYSVIMAFIIAVIYLGPAHSVVSEDLLYILIVSTFLGVGYLTVDYTVNRNHCRRLNSLINSPNQNWFYNLPEPRNTEERIYQDLLKRLNNDFRNDLDRFTEQNQADLDFVTTWVQQIKTPIAAARLLLENSLRRNRPVVEDLHSLEEELSKIEGDVQKALYYSRSNDFAKDYFIASTHLETLVKECVKKQATVFIHKKIRVIIEPITYEVATDIKWLGFILDQLLTNALKYTGPGGTITIRADAVENEIRLEVADTGIGIKPEDLPRVFQPSFTGDNGRKNLTATGMGLYLSQKLARKLGHYLTIASRNHEGTVVTIHFPKWASYFDTESK